MNRAHDFSSQSSGAGSWLAQAHAVSSFLGKGALQGLGLGSETTKPPGHHPSTPEDRTFLQDFGDVVRSEIGFWHRTATPRGAGCTPRDCVTANEGRALEVQQISWPRHTEDYLFLGSRESVQYSQPPPGHPLLHPLRLGQGTAAKPGPRLLIPGQHDRPFSPRGDDDPTPDANSSNPNFTEQISGAASTVFGILAGRSSWSCSEAAPSERCCKDDSDDVEVHVMKVSADEEVPSHIFVCREPRVSPDSRVTMSYS